MGRITVFTVDDCQHCVRAKLALESRNLPYTEISISSHPSKRSDMLSMANELTVPQVFFNNDHIGGADQLLAELSTWDADTCAARYDADIGSKADPDDARLAVPTGTPVPPPPSVPSRPSNVVFPGGNMTVLEMTMALSRVLAGKPLLYNATLYKNAFTGRDGVTVLMQFFSCETREDAVSIGRYLQEEHGILHHVANDHLFADTAKLYFRLQPFHTPEVLNSFCIWKEKEVVVADQEQAAPPKAQEVDIRHAFHVVQRCKKLLRALETKHTNAETGKVNLFEVRHDDELFCQFDEATCELQVIDMSVMDEPTRLAFGINVYNLMVQHASVKVGVPTNSVGRNAFFGYAKYNINGTLLSMSELEHGVLRANTKAPYCLTNPFGRNDVRLQTLTLSKLDPRLHFALNCGAKSCPPVKNFTPEAIDEELRIVAQAFCEQDTSVLVDETKMELHLSMIFNWYRSDFCSSHARLPEAVVQYLRGDKEAMLRRMMESSSNIIIKWITYDWDPPHTSENVVFEASALKANEVADRKSVV